MSQPVGVKKPNYAKAAIFFIIAIICIVAIVYNYMTTVVPAKIALDKANEDVANARAAIRDCYRTSGNYYLCDMDKLGNYK